MSASGCAWASAKMRESAARASSGLVVPPDRRG